MQDFINDFKLLLVNTEKRLSLISERESEIKPSPQKWSSKEILGHLIDSSINNTQRFVTGQFKGDLLFSGYDQDMWVKAQNYQKQDWLELIELWAINNQHILNIIKEIPEDILLKPEINHNFDKITSMKISQEESVDLKCLVVDYKNHMKHHLNQIYALNSLTLVQ